MSAPADPALSPETIAIRRRPVDACLTPRPQAPDGTSAPIPEQAADRPIAQHDTHAPCLSLPGEAVSRTARLRCRVVRQVVAEMVMLVSERVQFRRDRRRTLTHVRQIAMYVCHVVLQVSLTDIGTVFGRDRTTVSHACHVVEDRRDDSGFDDFVSAIERVVVSIFGAAGGPEDD